MSLKGFIFSFLWIASLLTIGSVFSFSLFDEILCLFILFFSLKKGFGRPWYVKLLFAYIFLHVIVSVTYGFNGLKPILLDALMYAKPFVCAIACGSGYFVLKTKDNNALNAIIFCLLFVLLADSVAAWVLGARDVSARPPFLFTTNFNLAGAMTLMSLFFLFTKKENEHGKLSLNNCFIYILLFMPVMITMQGKYFGFVFCFFFFKIFSKKILPSHQSQKFNKRSCYKILSLIMFVLGTVGMLYLAFDDLKAYYLTDNENVARVMMVRSLPKVLEGTYFFTGRGFGAFCSPITRTYYPAAFMDEIGLSRVYGLSRSYSNFMSDGYLWSYAGCFGFIGIILYVAFMIYMFLPFIKLLKNRILPIKLGFACLVCFAWIVIFSFGSGLMFGYGCFVTIMWGMLRWKAVQILKQETATA